LGLEAEAVEEYSEEIRIHPQNRDALAEACQAFLDLQRYDRAVWLAAQILRPVFVQANGRLPNREYWQCLYPLGYWPLVQEQAGKLGLDPYLVTALIREESAFAPRAVSRAGARGLMQLMTQTADEVAREHRMLPGSSALLEVPEVNVRLGTMYLAGLYRENKGSLILSLAAYNAGSLPVRRWVERYGFADEDEFIENIPYTETRNYVKRVLGSYRRYAALYAPRAKRQAPSAENPEPKGERRESKSQNKTSEAESRKAGGD
jgi:soluble lytic murein transglycosylase